MTFVILRVGDFERFFDKFSDKNFCDSRNGDAHVLMHCTGSRHCHQSFDLVLLEAATSVHFVPENIFNPKRFFF